jgi:hypothetical protein
MKSIKKIIIFALMLAGFSVQAQFNPYVGTWQYKNGNEVFIVKLWEENNVVLGYYKKITVDNNGNQTSLVFTSRIDYGNGDYFLPYTIYGTVSTDGINAGFRDNTMTNIDSDYKDGKLHMKITNFGNYGPPGCNDCTTATWKVTDTGGMYVNFVEGFSVPTDIVLTKLSDQVVFD